MNRLLAVAMTVALGLSLTAGIAVAKSEGNDNLGGLDLNAYCSHLGLSSDSHVKSGTQNWYCTATSNEEKNHIKMGEACEWQYQIAGKYAATSKEVVQGDPYTYNCFF